MPHPDHLLDYAEEDLFGDDDVDTAAHVNTAVPLPTQPVTRSLRSPSPPAMTATLGESSEAGPSRFQYPISAVERQRVVDASQTRIDELREKKRRGDIHEDQATGVMSLRKACLKVTIQHADRIWDVGSMTYSQVRPLLDRMPADQLQEIERNSKHLKKDTDWLWETFLIDEYPLYHERCREREGKPRDRGWRRMYKQAREDAEQRQAEAVRRVKERYDEIDKQRASKRIVLMDELVADKKRRISHPNHRSGTSMPKLSGLNTAQTAMAKARQEVQRERIAITHAAGKYKPPVNRLKPQGPTELFKNPYIAQEKAATPDIGQPRINWASNGMERLPRPRVRDAHTGNRNGARRSSGGSEVELRGSSPTSPILGSYPTAQRDEYRSKLPNHLSQPSPTSVSKSEERFRLPNEPKSKYQTIRKPQVQNFEPPKQKSLVVDFFGDQSNAPKGLMESLMRSQGAHDPPERQKEVVVARQVRATTHTMSSTNAGGTRTNGERNSDIPTVGGKRSLPTATPADPANVLFRKKKRPTVGKQ